MERRQKRKERGRSEDKSDADGDGGEKRARVSVEGKKERRRFEDRFEEDENGSHRESRRFEDCPVKEEDDYDGAPTDSGKANGSGSAENGAAPEPLAMASGSFPETSLAPSHSLPTKMGHLQLLEKAEVCLLML